MGLGLRSLPKLVSEGFQGHTSSGGLREKPWREMGEEGREEGYKGHKGNSSR